MSEDQGAPYAPLCFLCDELHLISLVTFPVDEIARFFEIPLDAIEVISTTVGFPDKPEKK
jgi:hypothetical protein